MLAHTHTQLQANYLFTYISWLGGQMLRISFFLHSLSIYKLFYLSFSQMDSFNYHSKNNNENDMNANNHDTFPRPSELPWQPPSIPPSANPPRGNFQHYSGDWTLCGSLYGCFYPIFTVREGLFVSLTGTFLESTRDFVIVDMCSFWWYFHIAQGHFIVFTYKQCFNYIFWCAAMFDTP